MTTYHLTVNGTPRSVEASDPDEPLLYILRNALGLLRVGQNVEMRLLHNGTERSVALAINSPSSLNRP